MRLKKIAKNLSGISLVIIGIAMVFTPGPGLVVIFAGMYITNFPGKPFFIKKLRKTKVYNRYLINIERKIKSKFKRKNV
jgi:putative transmembrane protein PGPGW